MDSAPSALLQSSSGVSPPMGRLRARGSWSGQAGIAFFGLLAAAALLVWLGRSSYVSCRRNAAAQLETALDSGSATVERWYRGRLGMLSKVRDRIANESPSGLDPAISLEEMGFGGFAIVSRDGHVLLGSEETKSALKRDQFLKDVVQQALTGGAAASGPKERSYLRELTKKKAACVAFAVPVWTRNEKGERSELALPNAALMTWVCADEELLPLLEKSRFGETGRLYAPGSKSSFVPLTSGMHLDRIEQGEEKDLIRAWQWLAPQRMTLTAEMRFDEAYAAHHAIIWPLMALGLLLAVGAVVLLVRIGGLLWESRAAARVTVEGKQVGHYVIEGKLGEGGMGVVYRARHVLMQRPAAIKLLDKRRADATCIARFEREVRMTALLSHPNTVSIYDYGLTEEGVFYYAMEYIDGVSLDALVEEGPLCEGRVIHLLAQLCGSLGEAHQAGLIHRDIKPANVLVTERGGLSDFVKLLDFGLVKAVNTGSLGITTDGTAVGTPLFMSPEAIESPEEIDARSDLYSVGAIGYYLLTGKHVFVGKSSAEVCLKHLQERPIPPSMRGPNAISPDLEHLILQCLEKDRDNRPPTAFDLQQSLLACREAFTWTEDEAVEWWSGKRELAGV